MRWLHSALLFFSLLLPAAVSARPPSLAAQLADNPSLVDVGAQAPRLLVQLRYSSADNFMEQDVYGDLERCYLIKPAAEKLALAAQILAQHYPKLRLLVLDCVRPLSVQRRMWRLVKGTSAQPYVANPKNRSLHNLGCAVDLTLADQQGAALDMGTPYDHAGPLAQPRREREQLLAGKLTQTQLANRLLLRAVMVQAGFVPLSIEWWHFDCMPPSKARQKLRPIP